MGIYDLKIYLPKKKDPPRVKIERRFVWFPIKTIEENLVWLEYVYKKTTCLTTQGEHGYYFHTEVEYSSFVFEDCELI